MTESANLRRIVKRVVPAAIYRPVVAWWRRPRPARFGSLRRLTPVSRVFGYDRGAQSVNRYYVDCFIARHATDVRGHVLEIGDDTYTVRFGSGVTRSDVLHVQEGNPKATIVADLTRADSIPADLFDCIILTQTLQFIYDVPKAVGTLCRILKPGGCVLATASGISQISRYDMDRWGEYWRMTSLSARRLFGDVFGPKNVEVEAYGNVLAATASLHGLAAEELRPRELEYRDRDYEVIIAVRAVKEHLSA